MAIIGLCGLPGCGKSEVRKMLEGRFGFNSICSKGILYGMSAAVTGLDYNDFQNPRKKNNEYRGLTHRQITGRLGDAVEAMFGDSYLVDRALAMAVDNSVETVDNYVLDSLRKTQTKNFPGFVVEVVSERGIVTGNPFDEYDRSRINYTLPNYGGLDGLEFRVEQMLRALGIENAD